MTTRRYYEDSYTTEFSAHITELTDWHGQPAVCLDQTYFYPTSGGQPNDLGTLNDVPVVDVVVREADQAVLHVLAAPLPPQLVMAQIDAARRADHRQQHTGQHILSQAFLRLVEAETVGFHLGLDAVTIDLNIRHLSAADFAHAEALANRVVVQALPVRAWFPADDEIPTLALRKTPDVAGKLRVVAIGEFDITACGGTHVANTAEVQLIKLLKQEKRSGGLVRIVFACGARALADYARKHRLVTQLAADLTCAEDELPETLNRLLAENKQLRRDWQQAQGVLLNAEADALLTTATPDSHTGWRVIRQAWGNRDAADLRRIAVRLTGNPGVLALLAATSDKTTLAFAASDDLPVDLRPVLQSALDALGGGRGGGPPRLVQGGGPLADPAQVAEVLAQAQATLSTS